MRAKQEDRKNVMGYRHLNEELERGLRIIEQDGGHVKPEHRVEFSNNLYLLLRRDVVETRRKMGELTHFFEENCPNPSEDLKSKYNALLDHLQSDIDFRESTQREVARQKAEFLKNNPEVVF